MYIEQLPSGNFRYQMTFIEERTGKKKRVSCTLPKNTDKAQREAKNILEAKISRINAGFDSAPATFGDVAVRFCAARADVWKVETARRYAHSLKNLCGALGADTLVNKLSAHYVAERIADYKQRAATRNEMLRTFKTVMRWAYRNDLVESVEWIQKLEKYPEPTIKEKNAMKYLEREELTLLLSEMKVPLNRLLVEFLALSGLRIGEALALQKFDVDLENRVIVVNKTLDLQTGELLNGAKTYASNRDVFIQDELLELCKGIKAYLARMSLACGFRSGFFFSDFDGKPLSYHRVNKYFRENCERVIHRRLSLHSLRHSHASLMFEAGASLQAVSHRLGHSDSRVTREIYIHTTERLREKYNEQFRSIKILQ